LNTLPNRAQVSSSWKQVVNERVAAHMNRKGSASAEQEALTQEHHIASKRAAAAAARVAARFASAPSYSEILANEARAAVRAAEAASRAALEAQAAAESVLAGLEAAGAAEPTWELHSSPAVVHGQRSNEAREEDCSEAAQAGQATEPKTADRQRYEIRWEPDLLVRQAQPEALHATYGNRSSENDLDDWRERPGQGQGMPGGVGIEIVEATQPIHANLIEFPRELVATRKVRPRRAEGPYASVAEPGAQLSIFEVDPGAISMEPAPAGVLDGASATEWAGPEWSGIELDEQPQGEFAEGSPDESLQEPRLDAMEAPALELAPASLRLMAAVVNLALILGSFLVAAVVAAAYAKDLPSLREVEVGSAVGLLVVSALYQALFYLMAKGTPGMRYAGISLCTFDGESPTRAQRCRRLAAMLVSVLPVGLGVMWSIFDEDRLSWHDRLSRTYLRRR
jgi:uncharacterized RDD family membrane protein YckC